MFWLCQFSLYFKEKTPVPKDWCFFDGVNEKPLRGIANHEKTGFLFDVLIKGGILLLFVRCPVCSRKNREEPVW